MPRHNTCSESNCSTVILQVNVTHFFASEVHLSISDIKISINSSIVAWCQVRKECDRLYEWDRFFSLGDCALSVQRSRWPRVCLVTTPLSGHSSLCGVTTLPVHLSYPQHHRSPEGVTQTISALYHCNYIHFPLYAYDPYLIANGLLCLL